MAVLFKDRFLDPILLTDRGRLPDPVISFDDLRNRRTLAAYTLHRNAQGLLDEITFNTTHHKDESGKRVWVWGRWAQAETLLHEQVHLCKRISANPPISLAVSTMTKSLSRNAKVWGSTLHQLSEATFR